MKNRLGYFKGASSPKTYSLFFGKEVLMLIERLYATMSFYRLVSAPQFEDREKNQVAKYLQVIIFASLTLNPIYCLILFFSLSNPQKLMIAYGGLFCIHAVSLFLLRLKYVNSAAIVLLVGGWLCFSFTSFILGGANSPAILGLIIVVILAGLLLNNRWTYFFTVLSIIYAIVVFLIESFDQLPAPLIEITPLYTWGSFIMAILILVVIYEISTEKLNLALDASRKNIVALNEKNKQLQEAQDTMIHMQKTESLGVLAGGIAHDFNNLLVGILGQASVGLYKMENNHSARKHFEKAILAAEKAGGLTTQLLAYSGRGHSIIEAVDLNKLVQDNIGLFQTAISRHVTFQVSTHTQPLFVNGDATQLQQVIMNLIINGVEAITHNHGVIQIKTFPEFVSGSLKQTDWIGNELNVGEYAIIEVSDNGIGMTNDVLKKIFDPFFTTKDTGQGLGLAAVQGIVGSHRGSLYVSSKLNMGTTFKVFLPLLKNPISKPNSQASSRSSSIANVSTILQIDDEQAVCETLRDILATQEINVLSEQTRQEGLNLFEEEHRDIDLVILDMTMPGLTLEAVIKKIQKINDQTPIILSSGFHRDEMIDQIDKNNVQGFISKPYSVDVFLTQLNQILKPAKN